MAEPKGIYCDSRESWKAIKKLFVYFSVGGEGGALRNLLYGGQPLPYHVPFLTKKVLLSYTSVRFLSVFLFVFPALLYSCILKIVKIFTFSYTYSP